MRHTLRNATLVLAALALSCASAAADPPGVRYVEAKPVVGVDGKALYDAYCATCHGPTGRGNGPAARFLGAPVPDLTTIAVRDGGFNMDAMHFEIAGRFSEHATMPRWDKILRWNYAGQRGAADLACNQLAQYVKGLQVSRGTR